MDKIEIIFHIIDCHRHLINSKNLPAPFMFGKIGIEPDNFKFIELESIKFILTGMSKLTKIKAIKRIIGQDFAEILAVHYSSENEQLQRFTEQSIIYKNEKVSVISVILRIWPADSVPEYPDQWHAAPGMAPIYRGGHYKVYPSLHGRPDIVTNEPVYFHVHCSPGGIKLYGDSLDNAPINYSFDLNQHQNLKVLFCHATGQSNFFDAMEIYDTKGADSDEFKATTLYDIIALSELNPGRVAVDSAYIIPRTPREKELMRKAIEGPLKGLFCFGSDDPLILAETDINSYSDFVEIYLDILKDSPEKENFFRCNYENFCSTRGFPWKG